MNCQEQQYLDLMRDILANGVEKADRTGIGTLSVFGRSLRFNLNDGFPLLTTKRVWFKGVVHELLWFLKGSTNIQYLLDNDVHIWDEWADEQGNLGPLYPKQWRAWEEIHGLGDQTYTVYHDQIKNIISEIMINPNSRRLVLSAWNVADLSRMKLPPCHFACEFDITDGKLNCMFIMRSTDVFLGLPFNIASYALLTHLIAKVTGYKVGDLVYCGGNVHLYKNHLDQAREQLSREAYSFPKLELNPAIKNIDDFKFEDIKIIDYKCHPTIKAQVAV